MIDYENYNLTATSYDNTRSATGCKIWYGELFSHFGGLSNLNVLDAGCGTGNYTLEMAKYVNHVSAIDVNETMLEMARNKIENSGLKEKVGITQGSITELPYEDCSFDAVMFNQVLHHLDPHVDNTDFAQAKLALASAARVLRPGGLVMINTSSRLQMRHSFWYLDLVPEARSKGVSHMIATEDLKSILKTSGFDQFSRTIPLDSVLQGEAFFKHDGPFDAKWRSGDSIWALASDDELTAAIETAREYDAAGTLANYMTEQDTGRSRYGQITFWTAVKS